MLTVKIEKIKKRNLICLGLLTLLIALTGCSHGAYTRLDNPQKLLNTDLSIAASKAQSNNEIITAAKQGIYEIEKARYASASKLFEKGLRLDPANGQLHFLNGLSYHMRSLEGDAAMLNLAETGYKLALRYDPSNHWAAYLLGQLYFSQQRYSDAQNQFSYGLLYSPDQPELLHGLAVASYYTNDIATGVWAAEQAVSLQPENAEALRAAIFMRAATGNINAARNGLNMYSAQYKKNGSDAFRIQTISHRIDEWQQTHQRLSASEVRTPDLYAGVFSTGPTKDDDLLNLGAGSSSRPSNTSDSLSRGTQTSSPVQTDTDVQTSAVKIPDMALIDVVILRTEENRYQAKGVNLLAGLKATLTGTLYEANVIWDKTQANQKTTDTYQTAPSLALSGLEYNFNIFNDGKNKIEVLARPSLLAVDNQTSQFYSGAQLHVQLSSNNSDGSLVDVPIGIHLNVTPKFLDDSTLQLAVSARRQFLEPNSEKVGFTAFTQSSDTSVDTTVVIKLGQTIILSGLSESEEDSSMDGVPFLQHVPGLQYLFSHQEKAQTKSSVLILLTPRKARYLDDDVSVEQAKEIEKQHHQQTKHVRTLQKERNIQSAGNIDAVLKNMEGNSYFRSFRTGDLHLNDWFSPDTLKGALARTVEFLYYY